MGALPGEERHLHSPSLADGVLRFHLLLVGERGIPGGRDITGGDPLSEGHHPIRQEPNGGRGKKGASLDRNLQASRGRWRYEE